MTVCSCGHTELGGPCIYVATQTSPDPPRTPAAPEPCGHAEHPGKFINDWTDKERGAFLLGQKASHPDPELAAQTPMQRLSEHTWKHTGFSGSTRCTECGISLADWEQMRQARAQLAEAAKSTVNGCYGHACICEPGFGHRVNEPECQVPADAMTALERQLTKQLAEVTANWQAAEADALEWAQVAVHKREHDQMRAAVVVAARALVESAATSYTLVVDTVTGNTQSDVLTNLRLALDALDGSHVAQDETHSRL